MTVIARRVPSIPVRTATATWELICNLIAPAGTGMRAKLNAVADLAAMLIAEEYTAGSPIIASGGGPQVRIYTLHGDDALDADGDVDAVQLLGDDWMISLPAGDDDLAYAQSILRGNSRVQVRPASATIPPERAKVDEVASIDMEALGQL